MTDSLFALAENLIQEPDTVFCGGRIGTALRCLRESFESRRGVALSGELLSFSRELESLICRDSADGGRRKQQCDANAQSTVIISVWDVSNYTETSRPLYLLFTHSRRSLLKSICATVPVFAFDQLARAMPPPLGVRFVNVAKEAGLATKTIFGAESKNKYLLETTGCGVAFIDHDNDGWLDIFLVNGTRFESEQVAGARPI